MGGGRGGGGRGVIKVGGFSFRRFYKFCCKRVWLPSLLIIYSVQAYMSGYVTNINNIESLSGGGIQ